MKEELIKIIKLIELLQYIQLKNGDIEITKIDDLKINKTTQIHFKLLGGGMTCYDFGYAPYIDLRDRENCFNKFIDELQKLSQKYGVWINACDCFEYQKQANYEYVKDYTSGDLFYGERKVLSNGTIALCGFKKDLQSVL